MTTVLIVGGTFDNARGKPSAVKEIRAQNVPIARIRTLNKNSINIFY